MPFSQIWPFIGRRTMPEETGSPDYVNALTKGIELGYKPRKLESEVYGQELANRINEGKAATSKEQAIADLKHTMMQTSNLGAEASLLPLRKMLLKAQYDEALAKAQKNKYFQDLMNDYFRGKGTKVNAPLPESKPEVPMSFAEQLLSSQPREEFTPTGQGLFAPQPQAEPAPTGQQLPFGINKDDFMKAMFYKQAGLTVPSNKETALTGSARDAESMLRLKEQYGENSAVYKQAEAMEKAKAQRLEDLSEIRHRQVNGLRPGDTPLKDPNTGELIGYRKQTTEKQKEAAKNISLFNSLYPLAFKGASPYSGPGATFRMEEDARKYKTDKAAQKRMDALLIADKALTNTTISEAARFQAGRTNQTYNRYAESLKADDVPARIKKWIKEGLLPASANLKAGVTWQQELNKAEKKALKSIPATHNYYFDPDKQFEHEQSMHQENEPEEAENNTVIVIDPNGKKFETTEENAKHLPKGWKRG
jgi:hypothetical protein